MPEPSILQEIEVLFLKRIAALFRTGDINREKANTMANEFLALTPFTSMEDLQTKTKKFIEKHPDMDVIEMPILNHEDKEHAQGQAQQIASSLQNKSI